MVKKVKDISTEEKILVAAKKIFITKGMDGARMQDIADEAGINKALLHYYFRNKDKLFEVIFKQTAMQIFPKFEETLKSDIIFFDKIRIIVDNYLSFLLQNPYVPLFVLSEMNKNPNEGMKKFFQSDGSKFVKKFLGEVKNEIKEGAIKPVNPMHLLLNIVSMCVFPFVAKPIASILFETSEKQFFLLMEERKKQVAEFIISAIKK